MGSSTKDSWSYDQICKDPDGYYRWVESTQQKCRIDNENKAFLMQGIIYLAFYAITFVVFVFLAYILRGVQG